MEQEIIQEQIKNCEREIIRGKISVGFYKKQELTQKKEDSAKTKLKRMQVEDSIAFNSLFLDYLKSL